MSSSKVNLQTFFIRVLKVSIFLSGLVFITLSFIYPEKYPKIWSYLVTLSLPFIPDLVRFSGRKPSIRLEIGFYLFLIITMVAGINFDLYRTPYNFDKIAHFVSGLFFAFVAHAILKKNLNLKTTRHTFKYLFIISLVAFSAILWEFYEFFYDQIFDGRMQQLLTVGLNDTMWDMVVTMAGGLLGIMLLAVLTQEC